MPSSKLIMFISCSFSVVLLEVEPLVMHQYESLHSPTEVGWVELRSAGWHFISGIKAHKVTFVGCVAEAGAAESDTDGVGGRKRKKKKERPLLKAITSLQSVHRSSVAARARAHTHTRAAIPWSLESQWKELTEKVNILLYLSNAAKRLWRSHCVQVEINGKSVMETRFHAVLSHVTSSLPVKWCVIIGLGGDAIFFTSNQSENKNQSWQQMFCTSAGSRRTRRDECKCASHH